MKKLLKILMLEDCPDDVILIERELTKGAIAFRSLVVSKPIEFQNALKDFKPDVILSDHLMPQFNSIEALKLCRAHQKDFAVTIPFILVTGQVSEEFAVQCFRAGADDYILKDHLKRLPVCLATVMAKYRAESERLKFMSQLIANQAIMKEAEHLAKFGSWQVDLITGKHAWSDGMYSIYGFDKPGEIEPDFEKFFSHIYPDDILPLKKGFEKALETMDFYQIDFRIIDNKGNVKHISSNQKINRNPDGQPVRLVGFNLDITEQKNAQMRNAKCR